MADDFYTVPLDSTSLRHGIARWLGEDASSLAWEDLEDVEQRGYLAIAKILIEDVISDPQYRRELADLLEAS